MSPIETLHPLSRNAGLVFQSDDVIKVMTSSWRPYFGPPELQGDFGYCSYFFCVRTDVPKFAAYVEARYAAFSWILRNSPYLINYCSDYRVKMTKSF